MLCNSVKLRGKICKLKTSVLVFGIEYESTKANDSIPMISYFLMIYKRYIKSYKNIRNFPVCRKSIEDQWVRGGFTEGALQPSFDYCPTLLGIGLLINMLEVAQEDLAAQNFWHLLLKYQKNIFIQVLKLRKWYRKIHFVKKQFTNIYYAYKLQKSMMFQKSLQWLNNDTSKWMDISLVYRLPYSRI